MEGELEREEMRKRFQNRTSNPLSDPVRIESTDVLMIRDGVVVQNFTILTVF